MTAVERLKMYANAKGISPFRMEKDLGRARSYLRQVKNISSEVLAIASEKYPDLNIEWVVTGEGTMLRNDTKPTENDSVKVAYLMERLTEANRHIIELETELHTLQCEN